MNVLREFIAKLGDLTALAVWAGYIGMPLIIFAETGLLIGIFLPGDSLLVTAGFLAYRGHFDIWLLGIILNIAATAGNQTGYWLGRTAGPKIFDRNDSRFFKKKYVERAHAFYARHGGKTIIIGRFVPIVRTLAPVVAGVGKMNYRTFLVFDIIGGIAWIWSTLLIGYYIPRWIPGAEEHIEKVILGVIFVSLLPGVYGWWAERRRARREDAQTSARPT